MLKQIKIVTLAVLVLAMFASCNNDGDSARDAAVEAAKGTPTQTASTTTTPPPPTKPGQVTPNANQAKPAAPVGPTTTITFEEKEFNFGTVKSGEEVKHIYKFRNTGKEPLVISNAKGSCGCTVPNWPKEPIPVGGEGEIEVVFNTKGKSGNQTKTVTITANTNPPQTLIYIKGKVEADPNAAKPKSNVKVSQ